MLNKVGKILKNKRDELGYTLGEVELKTRIQRIYLEAIEDGKFDIFGTKGFYQTVFTSNYAIFLGLDKNEILQLLEEDKEEYAKQVIEKQPKVEEKVVVEEVVEVETVEEEPVVEEKEELLSTASIFDEIQKISDKSEEKIEKVEEVQPVESEDINSIMEDLIAASEETAVVVEEEPVLVEEEVVVEQEVEVVEEKVEDNSEELEAINSILDDLIDENKSSLDDVLVSEMDNISTSTDAIDLEVAQLQEQITASISLEDIQNQYNTQELKTDESSVTEENQPVDEKTAIDLKIAKALGDRSTATAEDLKKIRRSKIIDTILVVAILILLVVLGYLVLKKLAII